MQRHTWKAKRHTDKHTHARTRSRKKTDTYERGKKDRCRTEQLSKARKLGKTGTISTLCEILRNITVGERSKKKGVTELFLVAGHKHYNQGYKEKSKRMNMRQDDFISTGKVRNR